MVDKKLYARHQYVITAQKASSILGCVKRGVASREKEVIVILYCAFMRLHLEYCVQACGPQYMDNVELLEWV